ncbi:sugar kinase [Streptomyces tubercidicus]|uniref:sugar kinase n=1 Tax=Streptomyces tubercidicus TaxID=47759 RepID=UPI0034664717
MTPPATRPRPQHPTVACLGETMASLAPAAGTSLQAADQLHLDIAGAESNVAMYLADHGVAARWVSSVGDDPLGHLVRHRVAQAGVDVSGVHTDPDRPTGVMFKDPGPNATRVHYYRRGSAAAAMTSAVLDHPCVTTASLLHLSGITPALSYTCRDLVRTATGLCHGPRRRPAVSFDVNFRPALWRNPPGAFLRRLANQADIVFVGLDEAASLWGRCPTADTVRALLPRPRILVVKDGAVGATAYCGGESAFVPALAIDVVEVVGAGDAFAAGFLAGVLGSDDLVRALRLGHLTAAAALRSSGDHGPLPQADLVEQLLTADTVDWSSARIPEM